MNIPLHPGVSPLPALLVNPSLLPGMVRRRERIPPRPPRQWRPPIEVQLGRDHIGALNEELDAAESVLMNVYRDTDILGARESALTEVIHLLLSVEVAASELPSYGVRGEAVRAEVTTFLQALAEAVNGTRHNGLPVLSPFPRLSPYATGARTNQVDIIWSVSTAPGMEADVAGLCRGLAAFHAELLDRGVAPAYSAQIFGNASLPFGDMSSDFTSVRSALAGLTAREAPQNALAALSDVTTQFRFRQGAQPVVVLLADRPPADDWGERREEALNALRDGGVALFALGVFDPFTGKPFRAYETLCEATRGRYINFAQRQWNEVISELAAAIADTLVRAGVGTTIAMERHLPVGPGAGDMVTVRFPDFSPEALGIEKPRLETHDDFVNVLERVRRAISLLVGDRGEKHTLLSYFKRITAVFEDTRAYRLDFHI